MEISRRRFISLTNAMMACAAVRPAGTAARVAPSAQTRLILLGTGGGPRPRKNSYPSSQVILINNQAYVVDCGDGVATQLARADVPLPALRHVFITHQHSDHNADYGNLLLLAWASGLQTRVDTWGPPPLARMTRLFFEMNDYDIRTRIADEGKTPLAPLVHTHELKQSGIVMQDENVTVRCALVDHPPVKPAFAYRFDAHDRSIVISGDTRYSDALIKLAQGADVLVHEAMYVPAVERLAARLPNGEALKKSILSHHTSIEDVGRVAEAAGVKTLVLSHFVPPDDPHITDQMWIDSARTTYKGRIIVGKDLLEI
ncbi:MAG: MBL fold metallo-hydrolase [Acidobacteria bacterium]|nr:MBL fold metallo-hydrolase [Acidobacteriota bacterium]